MKTDMCISMCFKLLLSVDLERVGLEGFIEYVQTSHTHSTKSFGIKLLTK